MFVALKPMEERDATAGEVIGRLRGKLAKVPGATLFLQSVQDIRVGGRMGNAAYQYTLQGDDLKELNEWSQKMLARAPQAAAADRRQHRSAGRAAWKRRW